MLVPVAVGAEREQPVGCNEFVAAEADRFTVVHLDRGTLTAAFAASPCPRTHLLTQPPPGRASRALVFAAAPLADGAATAAVLCTERGRPQPGTP